MPGRQFSRRERPRPYPAVPLLAPNVRIDEPPVSFESLSRTLRHGAGPSSSPLPSRPRSTSRPSNHSYIRVDDSPEPTLIAPILTFDDDWSAASTRAQSYPSLSCQATPYRAPASRRDLIQKANETSSSAALALAQRSHARRAAARQGNMNFAEQLREVLGALGGEDLFTLDKFQQVDETYRFAVTEFAWGNVDGRLQNFDAGVQYPTDDHGSYLLFRKDDLRFEFCVKPLPPPYSKSPIAGSQAEPFPWSTAPLAMRNLRGEFGLDDILGRGLTYRKTAQVSVVRATWHEDRRQVSRSVHSSEQRSMVERNPQLPEIPRPSNRDRSRMSSSPSRSVRTSSESSSVVAISPPPDYDPPLFNLSAGGSGGYARMTHTARDSWRVDVTVSLRRPPQFRIVDQAASNSHTQPGIGRRGWRRATSRDFCDPAASDVPERDAGPIGVEAEQDTFRLDHLTFRFALLLDQRGFDRLRNLFNRLHSASKLDTAILGGRGPLQLGTGVVGTRLVRDMHDHLLTAGDFRPIQELEDDPGIDFAEKWLILGLASQGIILETEIAGLRHALEQYLPLQTKGKGSQKACKILRLRVLTALFNEERIKNVDRVIRSRGRQLSRNPSPARKHVLHVYRVHITPTRLLLFPPEPETSNSVLRRFGRVDHFLRVTFTDENDRYPNLNDSDDLAPHEGTLARVRRILREGLQIAGRSYKFLASSSSQLDQQSCWFLHEQGDLTVQAILNWIGHVRERIVAKHAARIGQAFTTTRVIEAEAGRGPDLPDIKVGQYYFTDGCGVIHSTLAKAAAEVMGYSKGADASPAALQVRIGGVKGVLCVDDDLTLPGQYRVRPSMEKFKSKREDLNIVRISRHSLACTNRQCIMILSDLGVPDRVLYDLFRDARNHAKGLHLRVTGGESGPDSRDVKEADQMSSVSTATFRRIPR